MSDNESSLPLSPPAETQSVQYSYNEQYLESGRQEVSRLLLFFKKEPALAITVCYLMLCLTGVAFLGELFGQFDISIYPHLELSDFILGAIHYPATLAVFGAFVGIFLLMMKLEFFLLKRFTGYRKSMDRYYKVLNKYSPLKLLLFFAIVYLYVAAQVQASVSYERLINNKLPNYNLQLSVNIGTNEQTQKALNNVQLIANLSKYLWVYHQETKKVHVIAHESLLLLTPIPDEKTKSEKRATEKKPTEGQ